MKKFVFLFIVFTLSSLFAQDSVKQITHFDFDVANPVVSASISMDSFVCPNYLIFETHRGDSSNIASLDYIDMNDDFENLYYFTRDGFVNKNPLFFHNNYFTAVIWETNRNGNFDIAYCTRKEDGTWDSVQIATNTPDDETEVKLVENGDYSSEQIKTIFKRGTRIIIKDIISESAPEDTVFVDENGCVFSQPAATFSYYYSVPLIAVAVKDSAGIKKLAYRIKDNNGVWGNICTVEFDGIPDNLKYMNNGELFCDYTSDGKSSIYHLTILPTENNIDTVFTDSTSSFSNLHTIFAAIPTTKNYPLYFPYIFEEKNQNGTFIHAYTNNNKDTTISISVSDPQPAIGLFNYGSYYMPVYSVWIDSVNGVKNIFGIRYNLRWGATDDNPAKVNNFTLYQNYPNPFSKGESGNSVTTIKYTIPSVITGRVKTLQATSLKVYDILGREVTTLVNKQQPPGTYSVTFDAGNLPSGTYFYRLQIGKTSITKKMILLK